MNTTFQLKISRQVLYESLQVLPNDSEWVEWGNSNIKSQLIDLLVKYLLEEYQMDKDIFVNNRHTKVKREIKHLSWPMILTFSSCYCGWSLPSNPMCSSDKENYPTKTEFYILNLNLWQNS